MTEVAAETLHLVSRELGNTLQEARQALEAYSEQPDSLQPLRHCAAHLHTAQGVLRIVEIYGAALLAEEMEHVADYLIESVHDNHHQADALDALMRAMVQLPTYLDRVMSGGRDIALVLLPLLNDLRAVRGNPLLSEGTLLLLNLSSDRKAEREPSEPGEGPPDIAQLARRLRPRFQLSLLGWIRGDKPDSNLEVMSKVVNLLEKAATHQAAFQLWWVVGAVLEALCQGGLESSVSIKRLLAQTDRQLKLLMDRGEQLFDDDPASELLNNLLYYVARATTAGERITAVRSSFNLGDVLPPDEQVERARETLSAPSVKLMQTVAAAIKEDLSRVKDVFDIFVRTGMGQAEELSPQLEMLTKIADTLGVLGLGDLRVRIQAEIQQLQSIIAAGEPPDDTTLLAIAATLLSIEDGLDQHLTLLIVASEEPPEESETGEFATTAEDIEFKQVTEAVVRECIVNLARIKEAIALWVDKPDEAQAIDEIPHQLRGIIAALLMLGKSRAVDVVERIGKFVTASLRPGRRPLSREKLDRLADAIVSVEYYMETLQTGRSDPWYMLDNAESCLQALQLPYEAELAIALEGEPSGYARTVKLEDTRTSPPAPQPSQPSQPPIPPPVVVPEAERVDPEFLELFIEEAKEEIASINKRFPMWVEDSGDEESLSIVRRSFHTLKGSGRVVGAQLIGEFSWAIEDLLNRVINQTLPRTPPMIEFLGRAIAILPELVEQLEVGTSPRVDVGAFISAAQAFAKGNPDAPRLLDTLDSAPPQERREVTEEQAEGMDPVLREIFSKETAEHLQVIKNFLSACEDGVAPYPISEAMYRSCHTLAGSAKMAGARQGVKIAEPLDRYIRKLYDQGIGLPDAGRELCAEVVAAIGEVIEHIDEGTGYFKTHGELIIGLLGLEEELDREIHDAEAVPGDAEAPSPVSTAAQQAKAEKEQRAEFDPEIAVIFSEEATDILDGADTALTAWSGDRSDISLLSELQRCLHTLKGGARMAGIKAMGDLSHELESLVIEIQDGQVVPSGTTVELMQATVDELHHMREAVSHGMGVALPDQLVAGIRQALRAEPAAPTTEEELSPLEQASILGESESPQVEEPEPVVSMSTDEAVELEAQEPEPSVLEIPVAHSDSEEETPAELSVPTDDESGFLTGITELSFEEEGAPPEPPVETTSEPAEVLDLEQPSVLEEPAVVDEQADVGERAVGEEQPDAEEPVALEEEAGTEEQAILREPQITRPVPPQPMERTEQTRVSTELLDELLNNAGEISIFRGRLEQQLNSVSFNLSELSRIFTRLREQLRKLEMETEAQILYRHQSEGERGEDFDPLELDRYSAIQQFSRALAESVGDVGSVQVLMENLLHDSENLLLQQGRVTTELQNGLMRTRMVPFESHVPRLSRLVRQSAAETGKRAELKVEGGSGELDRQVLERMRPPFEHMLRNAVVHGIESPEDRRAAGKPETGEIVVRLHREGAEMVINIFDDGAGMDVGAIRHKAMTMGLLKPGQTIPDQQALQLVLEPGFSTAGSLTQTAGRGVGMDVVATEVKKLGGSLRIASTPAKGTTFVIRLPFTLAITQALIARVGEELYALPLPTVEGVARISAAELRKHLLDEEPSFEYGGERYTFRHLGLMLGGQRSTLADEDASVSVILVRAGEHSTALVTDELLGSREIVVKSVGPQLAAIRGISGATILGNGNVVIILDVGALVRTEWPSAPPAESATAVEVDRRTFALVVDDSITVRRVTQRLLERNGMRVVTAKDGMEALSILQEHTPDIILLDIEMPRMDGYEVAAHVRGDERLKNVPIVMITSRVGEKHRARAIELGVNDYLGKPYQESQLLEAIEPLVNESTR